LVSDAPGAAQLLLAILSVFLLVAPDCFGAFFQTREDSKCCAKGNRLPKAADSCCRVSVFPLLAIAGLPALHLRLDAFRPRCRKGGEKAKEDFHREMRGMMYGFEKLMSKIEPVVNPGNQDIGFPSGAYSGRRREMGH